MLAKNEKNDLETVAKGAAFVFFGMIFGKLLMYITKTFLARYFGSADYGLFALSFSIFMVLVTFSGLGVGIGITRFIAFYNAKHDTRNIKGSLISGIKITLPSSIFISILTFIFAENIALFFNKPIGLYIKLLSLVIPFFSVAGMLSGVLQGLKRMKIFSYVFYIYTNIITILGTIIGAYFFGMTGAIAGFSLGYVAYFLLNIFYLRDIFRITKYTLITKKLFNFSWPLAIVVIIWSITGYLDTIMLGYFKPASEVGIYNVSFLIASLLVMIYKSFTSIFYPVASGCFSKGKKFSEIYKTVTKWMMLISLPMFFIMFLFSTTLLRMSFGPEYVPGALSLSILSIGYLFSTAVGPTNETLNILGKTKLNAINAVLFLIIGFVLNILLIPLYGIVGCAIATTIATIFLNILGLIEVWTFEKINPFDFNSVKSIILGFILIIIPFFALKSLTLPLIISDLLKLLVFIIFSGLFLFLCIKLNILTKEDLKILKVIENKIGIKMNLIKKAEII